MTRANRIGILAAIAVLLAATGTVLAMRAPQVGQEPSQVTSSHEAEADDAPPTAEELAHAMGRLARIGITDEALVADLAATYGLGGAVRIVAWANDNEQGATIDQIRAMRDGDGTEGSAMGWGRIAREIGAHPGIGWIMGNGGGHGRDGAPGQQEDEQGGE